LIAALLSKNFFNGLLGGDGVLITSKWEIQAEGFNIRHHYCPANADIF